METSDPRKSPQVSSSERESTRRILLVEDSTVIRAQVTDVLTSAGYVVDQLPDGTGVQAQIRAAPPDLILLDILMPGIPGTEILVQLKKNPQSASIPVIMITAKSDEAELARCLESGATDFIGKPFGAVALLARIESALKAGDSLLELEHANTKLQYEIEARWRAEQELDRSKRRYGVAVEAGRIGLWEWDIKRDTVYLASYLQHMLLLEPNDLPRSFKDWLCRVHEADRHSLEVQFRQLSEGYVEGVELEHRLQRNDGSVMWVLTRARLERDKAGLPSTVNGVHADITERKAITDSLADSEAWNRSVLEAAADAILGVDDQGIIRSFNRTAEELFGYQSDEIVGQPVHLLLPENRRDWHVERFASFITGDFGVDLIGRRREVVAQRKNGAPVRVTLTVTEAKTEDSRLFTAVVQDLTKWDLREEELRQATAAADKANRAKSDFLANMSHEIRTPLNAILGFAQVLHAEVQDADIRHKLDAILSSGYHLLQLINDILDLSKIEAGKMQITLEDTSPTDIACGVIECLRGQARSKSLKLTDIWPDEIPITVNTDRARVAQLLFNLIGNALKFTEEGEVQLFNRFEVRNERCLWRMVVRDTGIGIPKDKLASIFSPFEQADSSVARTHGGTGLGLTICNWITQNLGGDLAVDSQVGTGSTFVATLDVGAAKQITWTRHNQRFKEYSNESECCSETQLDGVRVLLVEDGDTNRQLFDIMLRRCGAKVIMAENGAVGLRTALEQNFDVILLDMQMPVMDGYTAATRMREEGIETPIVALTAHAMDVDEQRCRDAGCTSFLSKPVDMNRLVADVARHADVVVPCVSAPRKPPSASHTPVEILHSSLPVHDPEFRAVVEQFIERLDERFRQMQSALRQQDLEAVGKLAHWLAGSAGTAGFGAFTEPARELVEFAKLGQTDEVAVAVDRIGEMVAGVMQPTCT